VVLAAALAGYPTAIQEQNSVPGFTNKLLGRFARAALIAFEEAAPFFPARKVALTGNPVRRRFVAAAAAARAEGGSDGEQPRLLVVGGSQGARAVNDLVMGAARILAASAALPPVVHQTGVADAERCTERYRALSLEHRVSVRPFIEDMAGTLVGASLVVGRAGALTLAELAIVGCPAVLLPLPTAADDHQSKNAEAFARSGAALVLRERETTPAQLAEAIAALLADRPRRQAMARAMSALARPAAAAQIVDRLEAMK
jgi:UDP-N-acetylglucosamine--N-acetylmuramyl-(pentapeptide) pyrophosphoryl-undecaprenol N-acetylglucosamine transferase